MKPLRPTSPDGELVSVEARVLLRALLDRHDVKNAGLERTPDARFLAWTTGIKDGKAVCRRVEGDTPEDALTKLYAAYHIDDVTRDQEAHRILVESMDGYVPLCVIDGRGDRE